MAELKMALLPTGMTYSRNTKAPLEDKRIFDTLALAQAYVDNKDQTAHVGLTISVVADTTNNGANNGFYYVERIADDKNATGLLRKISSAFTAGDGIDYTNNVIKVAVSKTAGNSLSAETDGLYVAVPEITVPGYTLEPVSNPDSAYASQYQLKKDGVAVGYPINIPKDQFLKNAEFVASLSVEDAATYGLESGKPYLKFTWQLDTDSLTEGLQNVTFVPVKDLVDTYAAGDYITISDNTISLNLVELSGELDLVNKLAQVDENTSDISELKDLKINDKSISTTSDGKTSIQDVTLTGADVKITGYTKGTVGNLAANDTINQALGKLEARVDAAASGGVQTVNGISGDVVIESGSTNGTIAVYKSGSTKEDVAVTGLKSAAFTDSTDYATSAQGSKADSAVQNITVTAAHGYDTKKEIVTVTKGEDNAINLAFNFANDTDIKAGAYLSELPSGGPLVGASVISNLFLSLNENKAEVATTLSGYGITDAYTKTAVDALFAWEEL